MKMFMTLVAALGILVGIAAQVNAAPATKKEDVVEEAKIAAAMPSSPVAKPEKARKVLVFSLCKGFKHSCIPTAIKTLEVMGRKTGAFETEFSCDMSAFTAGNLARFDALILNNTTKLTPDEDQRKAIMDFVKDGKGIVGIHAASDNFYSWPEGAEMMGGLFDGHPWTAGGTWAVKLDEPDHPLDKSFGGKGFKVKDEIYQVKSPYSREKLRVLLSLDMSDPATDRVGGKKRTDNDNPIAWIRSYGKGRVFYSSLGHNNEIYWNPAILGHYLAGIQYALGDLTVDDNPVPQKAKSL